MSFAGGIFTRLFSYTADAAAGITAQPARFDADLNDMATGLTSCLLRDGTGTPTANIGWGGYRITGLADPVNPQDAATRNYVMITMVGLYLPVTGGTLTGGLVGTTATFSGAVSVGSLTVNGLAYLYNGGSPSTVFGSTVAGGTNYDSASHTFRRLDGAATYGVFSATGLAVTGIVTSNSIELGFRDVPQNPQAAAYTLALTDRGQQIYNNGSAGALILTIPTNAAVAFPVGAAIVYVNDSNGIVTATRAAGVTMKLAGSGSNADRAIAIGGMATFLKVSTNTWFISGSGVS